MHIWTSTVNLPLLYSFVGDLHEDGQVEAATCKRYFNRSLASFQSMKHTLYFKEYTWCELCREKGIFKIVFALIKLLRSFLCFKNFYFFDHNKSIHTILTLHTNCPPSSYLSTLFLAKVSPLCQYSLLSFQLSRP